MTNSLSDSSATKPDRPPRVGGWLLLLCLLLIVWGPIELALVASSALGAVAVRGPVVGIIIIARVLVTALGLAAGMALIARRGIALSLARTSLSATAATQTFVYVTPYFPSNRPPGDEWFYVAASLLYATAWLLYLARSRRVRNTYA